MKTVVKYGKRIKELRQQKGWTQQHLEMISGINLRTVQRVEGDETRNFETLAAIASAFDLSIDDLGRRYFVPEKRPAKALLIGTAEDFRVAINRSHHDFVIQRIAKTTERIEELVSSIAEDMQYISPDDFELFNSFINSLRDPLEELRELGFALFSIQENLDLFVNSPIDGIPQPLENWGRCHFVVIPRFACFRIGGPSSKWKIHAFNPLCQEAVEQTLKMFREELYVGVLQNAVFAMIAQSDSTDSLNWCDSCFPIKKDGGRITMDYLSAVTGIGSGLERISLPNWEDIPIIGHA